MNLLRATQNRAVLIGVAVFSYGMVAAAMIGSAGAGLGPGDRFRWCLLFWFIFQIVLVIELVRCIRSCSDEEDGGSCTLRCIGGFVLFVTLTTLIFFFVCPRPGPLPL